MGHGWFPQVCRRILCRVSDQATIFICKAHRLLAATPFKPAKEQSATSLILSWTTRVGRNPNPDLVVETGHWYSHKEIVISPKHIDRISYEESKVFGERDQGSHPGSTAIPCFSARRDIWRYPEFRLTTGSISLCVRMIQSDFGAMTIYRAY